MRSARIAFLVALTTSSGLVSCESGLDTLYGSHNRMSDDYCETQCASTSADMPLLCDPVLHRCTGADVCPSGAKFCWADDKPVCGGAMLACGGCTQDAQCDQRWTLGYQTASAPEQRYCFVAPNADAGKCAECANRSGGNGCRSDAPICDQGRCRPCTSHEECGTASFCRLDEAFLETDAAKVGTCVSPELIREVSNEGLLNDALMDATRPFIKVKSKPNMAAYTSISSNGSSRHILIGERSRQTPTLNSVADEMPIFGAFIATAGTTTLQNIKIQAGQNMDALSCLNRSTVLYVRDAVIRGGPGQIARYGIFGDCAKVDGQRMEIRYTLTAVKIAVNTNYVLINLGIKDAGDSNATTPIIVDLPDSPTKIFKFNTIDLSYITIKSSKFSCPAGAKYVQNSIVANYGNNLPPECLDDVSSFSMKTLPLNGELRPSACPKNVSQNSASSDFVAVDFRGQPRTKNACVGWQEL